jgi:hypothetical protein
MELQLFNALFGCYFTTVYHILKEKRELTDSEYGDLIWKISKNYGFAGISNQVISEAITLGENEELEENKDAWPFFEKKIKEEKSDSCRSPQIVRYHENRLQNISDFPLSTIEKMWLKSLYTDPRIELFLKSDNNLPELNDIKPLFDWEDFVLFDQYADGDPFHDKHYKEMFRKVLEAVHKKSRLEIQFRKLDNTVSFRPDGTYESVSNSGIGRLYIDTEHLEYSERDNKFRLIGNNPRFGRNMVNIASIVECREVKKFPNTKFPNAQSDNEFQSEVIFEFFDSNNVLERFLLNFSHYEKVSEYHKESGKYRIKIYYDEADETDLLIRTLSFGPHVEVLEPSDFVELIRERLRKQRNGS